ncbi:MAG: outer membrane beta-barrel domain-containing protein [Deltaproteobacteria bacterium]|nr:MAG: outer membrane beta-barrel domain-containing protein [Deltaproteobacteria bacterium]
MRLLALTLLFSLAAAAEEPDVQRIHVLEQRPFTESGRWEVSFFGLRQVNPKFTVHTGLSAEVAVHLRENLAAQLGLTFFPIAVQSTLAEELLTKANESPTSAEAFLLRYAAVAGLELMPIYGKLDVLDGRILRLGLYLNAGLGLARTRLQLRPSTDATTGRSFGDTGIRPLAQLGVGLRVFVSERFTVRLELRDFAYSGYTSTVNGCNRDDARAIQTANDSNQTPSGLSPGCDALAFGSAGANGTARLNAAGAYELLKNPSSEVINNIAFQGGVSWLF